jgi:hypothetical protein
MDNTLKGTNVEFNKNTKQKIIKINSGYFWVPPRIFNKMLEGFYNLPVVIAPHREELTANITFPIP